MTQNRWMPGQPVPRGDEGVEPDPDDALARSVSAFEPGDVTRPPRRISRGLKLPFVSAEVRAVYDRQRAALVARYKANGKPQAEAERLALDDLGCVEFFDFMLGQRRSKKAA